MTSQVNDRRVLLGMPGYGFHTAAGAARSYWRASKNPNPITFHYSEGSLLAQNFNDLWCTGLNMLHHGEPIDYFVMQHADVQLEDFWLDELIELFESTDLDVLGVVVPIKTQDGVTSIALDDPKGSSWRPLCRLTMKEIYQLPETFTSEDVGGHHILINTGCWICKFDPEWVKKIYFTVNDRIVFNTALDQFHCEVEPEDWFVSRLFNNLGLKIGVTRKIKAEHLGHVYFPNTYAWGTEDYDSTYTPHSVVAPFIQERIAAGGFTYPDDIDGWLTPKEARALFDLSQGKRVLEVGSYCGKSTACIAQSAEEVVAVDPHDGRGTPKPKNTLKEMRDNLERYEVNHKVRIVQGTLEDKLDSISGPFQLAFIDGDHRLESVRRNIQDVLRLLEPGGHIAFHDYRLRPGQYDGRWDPGVTQAVNELLSSGAELISNFDSLAVVKTAATLQEVTHGRQ